MDDAISVVLLILKGSKSAGLKSTDIIGDRISRWEGQREPEQVHFGLRITLGMWGKDELINEILCSDRFNGLLQKILYERRKMTYYPTPCVADSWAPGHPQSPASSGGTLGSGYIYDT